MYFRDREIESACVCGSGMGLGRGTGRESQADSLLGMEHDLGLDSITLRSRLQ